MRCEGKIAIKRGPSAFFSIDNELYIKDADCGEVVKFMKEITPVMKEIMPEIYLARRIWELSRKAGQELSRKVSISWNRLSERLKGLFKWL